MTKPKTRPYVPLPRLRMAPNAGENSIPPAVSPHWPLYQAKAWLRERVEDGERCPCCGQLAKVYRRKIHSTIARALVDLYRLGQPNPDDELDRWIHVPTVISPACEIGKARYWGLVEERPRRRSDGSHAGWWRLTDTGIAFVEGRHRVPQYARVYDGRCLGVIGDTVGIREALGDHFDYDELMAR